MVREDLVAGLRNAVEKGESLEVAKYSFISAGYSREEVEEASRFVSTGVLSQHQESMPMPRTVTPYRPIRAQQTQPTTLQTGVQASKKEALGKKFKKNLKIILLIIIFLLLVGILILILIFKDQIIELFS